MREGDKTRGEEWETGRDGRVMEKEGERERANTSLIRICQVTSHSQSVVKNIC